MGKRLLEQKNRIDTTRLYAPREALELLKGLDGARFDESVEAHVHLNVDPRRADQMVRGTLMLPNGTGKTRRVAVSPTARRPGRPRSPGRTSSAPTTSRRA
jgi:large subunit ribosomal protein L1